MRTHNECGTKSWQFWNAVCAAGALALGLFWAVPARSQTPAAPQPPKLVTQYLGSPEKALDQLTSLLEAGPSTEEPLVIWLFDASVSLKPRVAAVADRLEKLYEELERRSGRKTWIAAAAFGAELRLLTDKPITDVGQVVPLVRAIPVDASGKENVFSAVHQIARRTQGWKHDGQILLVILTDERGDDDKQLETAVKSCRQAALEVIVVGHSAPFGRSKGLIPFQFEDGRTDWIPVDQGPESAMPELVAFPFWDDGGTDAKPMPSGYGPYALTRLCQESKGTYLIADDRGDFEFSEQAMQTYQPEYLAFRDYGLALKKNKAKEAVAMLASNAKLADLPLPPLGFAGDNNKLLFQQLHAAQKSGADLQQVLDEAQAKLRLGEKARGKLEEPRWQAAYDLALGRVLVLRVRAGEYNLRVAEKKQNLQAKANQTWRLVPSAQLSGGEKATELSAEGTALLQRVLAEHPKTPWATQAQRELSQASGWEWKAAAAGN